MSPIGKVRHHSRRAMYLIAALVLVVALSGAASAAVRILPLGDSITAGGIGGASFGSYRVWLYQDLRALGYDVDFVGSLDLPSVPPGADPDHEGHPGYTAGQVAAELPAWLSAYPAPEIALVHLGTNDANQGILAGRTIANLTSIVGTLRARNPSMTILVAQVIPTSFASTNVRIEALNREIADLSSLSTAESPVVIVDQWSGYDGVEDNQADGVHPLASGERKLADRWLDALRGVLGPRPIPGGGTPADLDGDDLFEDVNGNGRADFADVVLYFNQMTWIAANEPLSAFDCTANGRIDFADVVWLFNRL